MGKGSCLLGFATMGVQAIRSAMGCLCCLVCIGPLLVIVGIMMLVSPNNYAANVKTWNAKVSNYTDETVPLIKKTTLAFPSNTSTIAYSSSAVKPTGNTKDVTQDAMSFYWKTSRTYDMNSNNLKATVDSSAFAPAGATTSDKADMFMVGGSGSGVSTKTSTISVQCSKSSSSSSSSSRNSNRNSNNYDDDARAFETARSSSYCSSSEIRQKCASAAGSSCSSGDMNYNGGTVRSGNSASCTYTSYVPMFCQPMKLQQRPFKWVKSTELTSCDYPFTAQKRACSSSSAQSNSATFKFMSTNDPYIELSKITKGKMTFGLTELQQRLTGLALMVVGCCFIACLIGLCVAMRELFCGDKHENKAAVHGAFGRQYQYPAGYQPMQQQQPQMQQQPGYAQQQPQGQIQQQQYAPQQQQQYAPQQQQGAYGQPPPPAPMQQQQGYAPQQQQYAPQGGQGYAQPMNQGYAKTL